MSDLLLKLLDAAKKYEVCFSFEFYSDSPDKRYFVLSGAQCSLHDSDLFCIIINRKEQSICLETETLVNPIFNGDLAVINLFVGILMEYKDSLFNFLFPESKEENK